MTSRNVDEAHELGSRVFKTKIEPQPPSDAYNFLRVDISSFLASRLSSFMTLEAIIESTPGQRDPYYVLLVPMEYKDGTVMGDIEAYIEEKLAGCHLKLKVLYGRVGFQCSSLPTNPYRYDIVECGSSIGPAGENWNGSFGGYLIDEASGELFGVTCAHNLCRYSWETEGITAEQLVELLPMELPILQPSAQDKLRHLQSIDNAISDLQMRCDRISARADPSDPPSYKITKLQSDIQRLQKDKTELALSNDEFAVRTEFCELAIVANTLFDYALLRITNSDRQGVNSINGVEIIHPDEHDLDEGALIYMAGRSSGASFGKLLGYLGDGKVERIAEPFRCLFASGRKGVELPFSDAGDSGSWVRKGPFAIGYVFGEGVTASEPLAASWIADLNVVCSRIQERWGKKLTVYEEWYAGARLGVGS